MIGKNKLKLVVIMYIEGKVKKFVIKEVKVWFKNV